MEHNLVFSLFYLSDGSMDIGYDTLFGELGEQGYFLPYDGMEMQYPVSSF